MKFGLLISATAIGLFVRRVECLAPIFGVRVRQSGGGRAPQQPDNMPSLDSLAETTWMTPSKGSEARLTIVQITDVYTLENFPALKTLLTEMKAAQSSQDGYNGKVISMLTGDFLAPYLLSSVDRGTGMMNALAKTPIDYLTWGNHEADIDHRTVCRHVEKFPGTWLNTNMQDHAEMEHQKAFDVVEVCSPDGSNVRRVGLVALLSNDPDLYSHFKNPGAFGGATIRDPWETLREYKIKLETEEGCDVVLPLQHTYVPDDHRTCDEFDVPVVLSGHDHHRVDEIRSGTRLIKPGLDGIYATVLEMCWKDSSQPGNKPLVRSRFVRVDEYDPDLELQEETDRAYNVLLPLRNTELARVPPTFEPLSSCNSRGTVCTMGRLICSLIKSSLNTTRRQRVQRIDAVILMGGNIRGGQEYPLGSFFSLEALEAEIKSDEVVGVVSIPGRILAAGIEATHNGDPIPGWMQYDDGIKEEVVEDGGTTRVTMVDGKPLEPDHVYRVATKITDLTNGQSPPLTEYFTAHPECLPSKGSYVNVQSELMAFFARNLWRKLWEGMNSRIPDELCGVDGCNPEGRLATLDSDGDGFVTVEDIHAALGEFLGLSIVEGETTLAEYVHLFADTNRSGEVTVEDIELFCTEIPLMYENQKWRLAFPRPVSPTENTPQKV